MYVLYTNIIFRILISAKQPLRIGWNNAIKSQFALCPLPSCTLCLCHAPQDDVCAAYVFERVAYLSVNRLRVVNFAPDFFFRTHF